MRKKNSSNLKSRRTGAVNRCGTLCELAGVRNPRHAVIAMAQRTVQEYGRRFPPFQARELCELRKIRVYEQCLVDCDARLFPTSDGYIAEVHEGHRKERKNFSLCHEIGHTFFARDSSEFAGIDYRCKPAKVGENKFEEYLCNLAAVELLMPGGIFRQYANDLKPNVNSLSKLAKEFQVSLEAAIYRILDLDVWSCCFLCFNASTIELGNGPQLTGWQPSVTLGKNPLMILSLMLELQRMLATGPLVDYLQRCLSQGSQRMVVEIPTLKTLLTLETYSVNLGAVRQVNMLLFLGARSDIDLCPSASPSDGSSNQLQLFA